VSIGLRAKTARAIAVVLSGPADSPQVLRREELSLVDPDLPATGQPYHEVMELPWEKAQVAVLASARAIEAVASKSLAQLVRGLQSDGLVVCGVGVVGALERNLERIGSAHVRAHAAEGLLFRSVLDKAAEKNGLERRTFEERKLLEQAASELGCRVAELAAQLAELGRATGPPWRADEKSAAAAAWLALRSFERKRR
jgi:hypothetical protein